MKMIVDHTAFHLHDCLDNHHVKNAWFNIFKSSKNLFFIGSPNTKNSSMNEKTQKHLFVGARQYRFFLKYSLNIISFW